MDRPYKIVELKQGTPEWHAWRHKGIGASDAKAAISKRGISRARLLRDKRAFEPPENSYTSEAMDRGTELEPKARRRYNETYGNNIRAVCVQSTQYPWLRASLDGLSDDGNLVVEIKCGAGVHQQALERFPVQYKGQVQHILAVTGLPSLHFWCYWPKSPNPEILHVIKRDEEYIKNLLDKEQEFWREVVGSTNWDPDIEQITREPDNATTLDLSNKKLTDLPSYIRQQTNLTHLDLQRNQLTALPDWIGELTNLTDLGLSDNQLTALPDGIGELTNLTRLYLSGNQLTGVPVRMNRLTKLRILDLSENVLTVLPPDFQELIDRGVVNLSGNPLGG